jgi:selenocysteine-specific elongation factor
VILGTAGHIDHGKTTLVKALTGVDTDRLPEEKRRGITIELGFAPLTLDGVGTLGVVDVPGHEAFVRTMLAGATGIDLALLVIAADEGVMPQTREHLAILGLLDVRGGVVALTKSDLVDDEWRGLVEEDVRTLVAGSSLAGTAIVACSARTGAGLGELRAALADAARRLPQRAAADLLRLPVDRVFTVKGTGTVVTGTLWSGALTSDSQLRLFPGDRAVRVRGLESHGASVDRATAGCRVAVALAGVDRGDAARGAVLVEEGSAWRLSAVLRADVALLGDAPPLGVRSRVRFHLGTADVGARVVPVSGRTEAGRVVAARVVLDERVVARAGDRFVLRSASPAVTIGGGVVTDPQPPARRARPWPASGAPVEQRMEWMVRERGGEGLAVADLPVRLGTTPGETAAIIGRAEGVLRAGDRLFSATLREALRTRLVAAVDESHKQHPLEPGMSLQHARSALQAREEIVDVVLHDLIERGKVHLRGGVIARAGWVGKPEGRDAEQADRLAETLRSAGANPPSVAELGAQFGRYVPALLRALERDGRVVAVATDRYFSREALDALLERLRAGTADDRERTPSEVRVILGLTRKYLIPFLEYCDRTGLSTRRGDGRRFAWQAPGHGA